MMELKSIICSGKFLRLSEEAQRLFLFMAACSEGNWCDKTFVMRLSEADESTYLELYESGFVQKSAGDFASLAEGEKGKR